MLLVKDMQVREAHAQQARGEWWRARRGAREEALVAEQVEVRGPLQGACEAEDDGVRAVRADRVSAGQDLAGERR